MLRQRKSLLESVECVLILLIIRKVKMENKNGENFMIATIIAEFFAVMGYALAFNLMIDYTLMPLVLFSMVVVTQKISGGHVNPAVTFGVYLER
jgi:Major intrinsic protein